MDQGRGGPGILVADDDLEMRRTICEALNHHGFTRVFQAGDGEACMAMYRQHADAIRVLVLDVMMPNKSGAHVLDGLMQLRPRQLGILLLSGHMDSLEAVCEKYRSAGGPLQIDTLAKPFRVQDLAGRIKRMLLAQGGPSALVGQGVLNTPDASADVPAPMSTSTLAGGAARGPAAGMPAGDLSRLERQLSAVESQLAELVGGVSTMRRLLDDVTRARR
jgi:DNA-binding response OmpR family regulator